MAGRAAGMCVAACAGGGMFALVTKAVIGVPPPPPPPAPPSVAVELLKKEANTLATEIAQLEQSLDQKRQLLESIPAQISKKLAAIQQVSDAAVNLSDVIQPEPVEVRKPIESRIGF